MSDAKGQQHEPSMEEILASIRRIIAEDGDAGAPATAPGADLLDPPPAPAPSVAAAPAPSMAAPAPESIALSAPADDILELTEAVEPDGSVVSLGTATPPKAEPARESPPRAPEPAPADRPVDERIVSPATAAASVAALSQIASMSSRHERRERDIGLGAGPLTLEMLVREERPPILKDWLEPYRSDMV